MFGDNVWAFVVVGGFLILGGVMAYAKLRNRASDVDELSQHDGPPPNFGEVRKSD